VELRFRRFAEERKKNSILGENEDYSRELVLILRVMESKKKERKTNAYHPRP